MKKEWFVIHTLTGQENKVQTSIKARIGQEEMGEYIGQCIIPTEKVTETRNGKKHTLTKKIFPGYVLVEMALYDESGAIDKETHKRAVIDRTWQFMRETPGIIGSWLMKMPLPLKQSEVEAILSTKPAGASEEKPRPKVNFNVGDTVKVNDGPFQGWMGVVSMVDPDKGKLTLEVMIFNRKAPVDVEYWQVEKVTQEELAEADAPQA